MLIVNLSALVFLQKARFFKNVLKKKLICESTCYKSSFARVHNLNIAVLKINQTDFLYRLQEFVSEYISSSCVFTLSSVFISILKVVLKKTISDVQ